MPAQEDQEGLKLENQFCFPLYAASRLVTKLYQPHLDELHLTYPQYLVLLVLWEQDGLPVNSIGSKLYLHSNTLTPLLKRLEQQGLVQRQRSLEDERQVHIYLTEAGAALKKKAAAIPEKLAASMNIPLQEAIQLKSSLEKFIASA